MNIHDIMIILMNNYELWTVHYTLTMYYNKYREKKNIHKTTSDKKVSIYYFLHNIQPV